MAIRTSELTQLISEQVTKDIAKKLIPKLRRVIREEIDRSMKDMLYELVVKQQIPLRNNNVVEDNIAQFNETAQPENISSAKNFIAQRQASRAKAQHIMESNFKEEQPVNISTAKNFIAQRQASRAKAQNIIANNFKEGDPFASLIMNVEDPQEQLDLQQEQLMNKPMTKIAEVDKSDVIMPEHIDYSEAMERLI